MGDVLSQDEIDSLLSALNSGEINPDEIDDTPKVTVKDYDFARPSKLRQTFVNKFAGISAQVRADRGHECRSQYIF